MGAASVSGSNNPTGTLAMGPLQDNGGATETMVPGAAAIDAGTNDGCPATDQRGVARPIGAACDIGALEAGNAALSALSLNSGAVVLSPSFISTTVTLLATDDAVDSIVDVQMGRVAHVALSEDSQYHGYTVEEAQVEIVDNDQAGLVLSAPWVAAGVGGQASYTVVLSSRPLADVFVEVDGSTGVRVENSCAYAIEGVTSCLVFTPETWDQAQSVVVTALVEEAQSVDHMAASADDGYHGRAVRLYVNGSPETFEGNVYLPLVAR
jgi:hypothetical protein